MEKKTELNKVSPELRMLKPLIETIPLLEMPHYAFKFFLPAEIKSEISSHIRSDRFDVYPYTWKDNELKSMFEYRLSAYCDNDDMPETDSKSFERLFEKDSWSSDIVSELIQFSNHSPRDMIKLAKTIFDEHTRSSPIDELISKQTYENALSVFANEQIRFRSQTEPFVSEIAQLNLGSRSTLKDLLERDLNANAAEELIRTWQKNDHFFAPHFSITDIVRFLDRPKSEARELAKKWEDEKLIETHYRIADQSLARYIYAKKESKP
ncbi:MAG: hypothetical protein DRI57_08915 [Deltaproteobacteria bacterium]|nr:MAG: hypothetical protein DRI57_08915 [Deltaproteobacteria bacterium]